MTAEHDHRRAWELIPWYVNGTLEPAERDRVEAHLAVCPDCRAEADLCRELVEAGGRPEDLAPAPHPAQLDRLVDRIAAESEEPGRSDGPLSRLHRLPPAVRLLAAALVLLAVGLAGYLGAPGSDPDAGQGLGRDGSRAAEYRTLSQPETALDARPDGPVLRIVFAPSTPEEEVRRILLAVQGQIVGGPSPLGVYTVRPGAAEDGTDPLPVVLQHLRRQPEVLFVEPVGGGTATERPGRTDPVGRPGNTP